MSIPIENSKTLLLSSVVALLCGCFNAFAQVSNVEGLKPLEGVTIPKVQPSKEIKPGISFKDCNECPEMVMIPAGQFVIGASPGEEEREDMPENLRGSSQPQNRVEIKRVAVGKYSVTRAEYEVFVNATGRQSDGCYAWTGQKWEWKLDLAKNWRNPGFSQDERHPVICVNFDDVIAYVKWLSEKTGKDYRLLSEAEWEYSARAGTTTYRYWGDDGNQSCAYANVADQTAKAQVTGASNWDVPACNDGYAYTAPVGSFKPNRFGLYDMLGNVWQWTQDCRNNNFSGAPLDGSAWTTGDCSQRVVRGGSWAFIPMIVRSAYRTWNQSTIRHSNLGFRVARTN